MMAIAYVLKSDCKNVYYKGSSGFDDPNKRLKAHNSGRVKSTKSGRPWRIIHVEYFKSYTEAREREVFLKSGQGRNWIKEKFCNKANYGS